MTGGASKQEWVGGRTDSNNWFAVIKGETYDYGQMTENDIDALSIKINILWVSYQQKTIKRICFMPS